MSALKNRACFKPHPLPLGAEMGLTLAFMVMAAVLLSSMVLVIHNQQQRLAQEQQHAQRLLSLLCQIPPAQIPDTIGQLLPAKAHLWRFDAQKRIIQGPDPATGLNPRRQDLPLARHITVSWQGQPHPLWLWLEERPGFYISAPSRSQPGHSLQLYWNLASLQQQSRRQLGLATFYSLAFGAVIWLLGYWLLWRHVLRPVSALTRGTQTLQETGSLPQSLAEEGPKELASLAQHFNAMAHTLQANRHRIEQQLQELQQLYQQQQQRQQELIRAGRLAATGQLAAGMAHELGNPLSAVSGYLEILQQRAATSQEQEIAAGALQQCQRMDGLLRELLDFARPQPQQAPCHNINATIEQSLAMLRHQGLCHQRQLQSQLAATSAALALDCPRLEQILVNLLLNACQATDPANGIITVHSQAQDNGLQLTISDNGCGMDAATLELIWDPFFTRKDHGQGLGLAVCAQLVASCGGHIDAASEPGQGSTFTLWLPWATDLSNTAEP